MSGLLADVGGLLDHALAVDPSHAVIRRQLDDLHAPPRLAVTGAPGTGRTTLARVLSDAGLPVVAGDRAVPGGVDAVVHVVPALAGALSGALESGPAVVEAVGPAGRVLVLGRADVVGGGGVDAVLSARSSARRAADTDPRREQAEAVVAVAGLLAVSAPDLDDAEFAVLAGLAARPRAELDAPLAAADRFADVAPEAPALLDRFGLFGIRTAVMLLRRGVGDAATLRAELARRSGRDELLDAADVLVGRRDALRARAALDAVAGIVGRDPGTALATHLDRVRAGAHALDELARLAAIRAEPEPVGARIGVAPGEAERLLGARGSGAATRLGLDPAVPATRESVRPAALDALDRWRALAGHPLADRPARETAAAVVRSLEELLADLGPRAVRR